jgi:hypothetical protein
MTTLKNLVLGGAALACLSLASAPASATGFGLHTVRGSYGYTLEGTVGESATSYVEAGRIVADGRGNLTGFGRRPLWRSRPSWLAACHRL